MKKKPVPFIVRGFPAQLHKRLKLYAVEADKTMLWVILRAIEEYLDREEGKESKNDERRSN